MYIYYLLGKYQDGKQLTEEEKKLVEQARYIMVNTTTVNKRQTKLNTKKTLLFGLLLSSAIIFYPYIKNVTSTVYNYTTSATKGLFEKNKKPSELENLTDEILNWPQRELEIRAKYEPYEYDLKKQLQRQLKKEIEVQKEFDKLRTKYLMYGESKN